MSTKSPTSQNNINQKYQDPNSLIFKYTKYESPFSISINPNYSEWMDRYCTQWAVDNSGLMKNYSNYRRLIEKSDNALFSAVTYPSANWHRIEKLMKWSLIFFICDDYHDICVNKIGHEFECKPFWNELTDALDAFLVNEYYTCNDWPDFVKAVQQILREIYFDYNQQQVIRSVNMIKDYVLGNVGETEWNNDKIKPLDWDDYLVARLGSVGGQMALQFIEYAKDIELTDNEWNETQIQTLNKLVSEQIILINDYYTFRKEVKENNCNFYQMKHPFAFLVNNKRLSLQSAVNTVNELIKQKDYEILKQFDKIKNMDMFKSEDVASYIIGVNEFLGGYWRHAVTARRYHGFTFTGVLPIEGLFVYDQDHTIIKPLTMNKMCFDWSKPIPKNIQPKN